MPQLRVPSRVLLRRKQFLRLRCAYCACVIHLFYAQQCRRHAHVLSKVFLPRLAKHSAHTAPNAINAQQGDRQLHIIPAGCFCAVPRVVRFLVLTIHS